MGFEMHQIDVVLPIQIINELSLDHVAISAKQLDILNFPVDDVTISIVAIAPVSSDAIATAPHRAHVVKLQSKTLIIAAPRALAPHPAAFKKHFLEQSRIGHYLMVLAHNHRTAYGCQSFDLR
jgi:hypothetical protein